MHQFKHDIKAVMNSQKTGIDREESPSFNSNTVGHIKEASIEEELFDETDRNLKLPAIDYKRFRNNLADPEAREETKQIDLS